jgi:8-oxo-dGTP pyrophosphatase MutT (NUDIX family)
MAVRRQVAALPLRQKKSGEIEVLLITSRGTGRWVIPKGWTSKRLKDHEAAIREAKQEAGVDGKITTGAIGSYRYFKSEISLVTPIDVAVYLLAVEKQWKRWPEKQERQRVWLPVEEAAEKVQEPDLSRLILAMLELPADWGLRRVVRRGFKIAALLNGG